MPKPSRFFTIETSQISEIATRLERRMRMLGLSVAQLSTKCSMIGGKLEDENHPGLSRSRIAKILMNRGGTVGRSAAKVIARSELLILARALEVSVEWLSGQSSHEDPIVWSVLAEPARSGHILHLFDEHEGRTNEVIFWSEYLISPFVTQEFMYAFHRVHFSELLASETGKDALRLAEFFNKLGNNRRTRTLRSDRSFGFTGMICQSELRSLSSGGGVYERIPKSFRKRCMENLIAILGDPALKLTMIIIDEKRVEGIRSAFLDFEIVGVVGDAFSIWNYHSGNIGWSEHPKHVERHLRLLKQMRAQTDFTNAHETCEYLKSLSAKT